MKNIREPTRDDGTARFTNHSDCRGSKSSHFSREGVTNKWFRDAPCSTISDKCVKHDPFNEIGFSCLQPRKTQLVIKDRERDSENIRMRATTVIGIRGENAMNEIRHLYGRIEN